MAVDSQLVIGDEGASINEGVLLPWSTQGKGLYSYFVRLLDGLTQDLDFSLDTPWQDLAEEVQDAILKGNDFEVQVKWRSKYGREMRYTSGFEGVLPYVERRYLEADSDWARGKWSEFLREIPCPECDGSRLRPEVLAVKVHEKSIHDVAAMSLRNAHGFFETIELSDREATIAAQVLREIRARLDYLLAVGLDYLSLERAAGSLSGGEAQRVAVARALINSPKIIFADEPTGNLDSKNADALHQLFFDLRDRYNQTFVIVTHNKELAESTDRKLVMKDGLIL